MQIFQPSIEQLIAASKPTHFILSGYLRNSMTFKIFDLAMQHDQIVANYWPYELPKINDSIDFEKLNAFMDVFQKQELLQTMVVSHPYKQIMLDYIDQASIAAKNLGVINFVIKQNGKLFGDNLDAEAFLMAFEDETRRSFKDRAMLFFGCGGVSTAIAYQLASQLKMIGLVDIDNDRCEKLKELLIKQNPKLSILIFDRRSPADFTRFDVFYNGTGLGKMSDNPNSLAKTPLLAGDLFPQKGIAIDANYHPWQTAYLKEFAKRNYQIVNGFGHMIASSSIHLSMIANRKIEFQALKKLALNGFNMMSNS